MTTAQMNDPERDGGAAVGIPVDRTVRPGGEAPRWWHCDTHGPGNNTAWGCPECVREMRGEIKRLVTQRDDQREKFVKMLAEIEKLRSLYRGMIDDKAPYQTWLREKLAYAQAAIDAGLEPVYEP